MDENTKRKISDDDDLFSYSNTIEFSFGKKPKMGRPTLKKAPNFGDDSDSTSGLSDLDEEEPTWTRTHDSSDESDSEIEDISDHAKPLNESQEECLSPSPPPPPKLDPMQIQSQRRDKSSKALTKALFSLYNEKYNAEMQSPSTPNGKSSKEILIVDESPLSRQMMIKIKCHGIVNKYKIKQNEPFRRIINMLAEKEKSSQDKILLYLSDRQIKDSDTPLQIGCTVADIIECVIAVDKKEQLEDGDEDTIRIKIQGRESHSKLEYVVKKTSPLESAVIQYCTERKIKIKDVKIYFDGELVNLKSTPNNLDMDNDDIIDLMHK